MAFCFSSSLSLLQCFGEKNVAQVALLATQNKTQFQKVQCFARAQKSVITRTNHPRPPFLCLSMHLCVCCSRRRRCRLCMEPYKTRSKAKQTPAPDTLLGGYYMHLLARAQSVVPEQVIIIHVIILGLGCIFACGVLVVVTVASAPCLIQIHCGGKCRSNCAPE